MKLSEAIEKLERAGVDDPRGDATEIFLRIGGYDRISLMLSDPDTDDGRVIDAVLRRAEREPLQYIIGEVFFYRESYEVNESCLIPRSDTEHLVEYAVKNLPEGASFLDLCTGSGCVGISTLCNTKNTSATLVDISEGALRTASRNAERNGVSHRLRLVLCDVMNEVVEGEYYAVLSNPPYVKDAVYETLAKEIFREPKIAFVGGIDGADFYRRLTEVYKTRLARGGFIAYEIGYDQAELLCDIAKINGMSCEIIKDFSGNDRVAVLKGL